MQFRNKLIILTLLIFFVVTTGFTQVYYEQITKSNGVGGKMAFTSQTKVYLTPSAKFQKTDTKFTGSFMKHFNSKSNQAEITRLDKECLWSVNYDKKNYTETTFAQLKQIFEGGADEGDYPEMEAEEDEEEVDESEYEWEKPVVTVTQGKSQKINGFKCQEYIIKVLTVGKHKQTGIRDTMLVVSDLWNSVVEAKAMTLIKNFEQELVKKMGFEKPDMGMAKMLMSYKEYFKEISNETQKIKGYPIRNTFRMTSSNHVKAATKKESAGDEDESIDLSKNSIGGMLGGFGKKMMKNKMKKKKKDTGAAKEVFQFTTELKVLKMEKVGASKFDVPAGFKKVEMPKEMQGIPKF